MATDKAQDPWHGEAETLSFGDCLDREAETLRLRGKLKMKLSERSFSEPPINPRVPAHPNGTSAEQVRLNTQAASPLQQCPANPGSQHCGAPEPGSARSRAGARPPRSGHPAEERAASSAGQGPGSLWRAGATAPRQFGSAGWSKACTDPLLGLGSFGCSSLLEQQMVLPREAGFSQPWLN